MEITKIEKNTMSKPKIKNHLDPSCNHSKVIETKDDEFTLRNYPLDPSTLDCFDELYDELMDKLKVAGVEVLTDPEYPVIGTIWFEVYVKKTD